MTSLSEQLLATRQARLSKTVEEAAPKAWRAGKKTVDGQTTVTTKPYEADQSPEHTKLLEDNGYDPERFKIVGPVRQTSWTAYIPGANRDESGDFTFQAKAYRFQVIERLEGELSIDELIDVVNYRHTPARVNLGVDCQGLETPTKESLASAFGSSVWSVPGPTPSITTVATGHGILDPTIPYVVALGDTQIGKGIDSPTEELLERTMSLLERAAAPVRDQVAATGVKFSHIHTPWLGDCIEGMNSQGGRLRWRTTLTITEQVRVLRRLMLYAIELFAPLTDRLTVVSVPGNHDQANARDLDTRMDDSWAIEALNQVSDALEYALERFGHVECYVPTGDEEGVTMEVGDTIVAHIHGHTFRSNQEMKWWAGQSFGGHDLGRATVLLHGHQHHWQLEEDGFRKRLCVPALEEISHWWRQRTGTGGSPGLVTFQLSNGELTNISKLEPPKEVAS